MAGAETVAQLLRQQLRLRRRGDQLDAFGPGAGARRGPVVNADTCSAWIPHVSRPIIPTGGKSKEERSYIGFALPSAAWSE